MDTYSLETILLSLWDSTLLTRSYVGKKKYSILTCIRVSRNVPTMLITRSCGQQNWHLLSGDESRDLRSGIEIMDGSVGRDNVLLTFFTRCWWRSTPTCKRRMNLKAEEERAWINYRLTSICFASSWKYLSLLQKPWRSTCEPAKVDEKGEGKRGGEVRMVACLQWVAKNWRNKFKFKLDTEVRTQANVLMTKPLRLVPPANCQPSGLVFKISQSQKMNRVETGSQVHVSHGDFRSTWARLGLQGHY